MGKNFNITEILESVDSIISNVNDQSYKNYNKKEIINNYKLFTKKYKSKINNPETEKIINDAEKSLEENKIKAASKPINIDYTHKVFPDFDRLVAQGAYSTVHPCQFGEQTAVIKVPRTFDDDDRRTLGSRNAHQREINFFNQIVSSQIFLRVYNS